MDFELRIGTNSFFLEKMKRLLDVLRIGLKITSRSQLSGWPFLSAVVIASPRGGDTFMPFRVFMPYGYLCPIRVYIAAQYR